ncbi:MAG: SsrA-binding protein SmpB [Pseudomonadota bacterium]
MAKKPKTSQNGKVVAENRRARYEFALEDAIEAGIQLTGTEVKSLRNGKAMIAESYASAENGELFLINSHIPEYLQANRFNHSERRPRKLLVHRRELNRLIGATQREGMTIVPLRLYFNDRGMAKVAIALGKGKKLHDKRETEKQRDWQRQKGRIMREHG